MPKELKPLPETLRLLYERTQDGPKQQLDAADSIDGKAFQIFSAATIVLGLGTFVAAHHGTPAAVLYAIAAAFYALAALFTWLVVRTRQYERVEGADRWWPSHRLAEHDYVLQQLLETLARADAHNRKLLDKQGDRLELVLGLVALEATFLAAAVIAALS